RLRGERTAAATTTGEHHPEREERERHTRRSRAATDGAPATDGAVREVIAFLGAVTRAGARVGAGTIVGILTGDVRARVLGDRLADGLLDPLHDLVGAHVDATTAARRRRVVDATRDGTDHDGTARGVEIDGTARVTEAGVGRARTAGDELATRRHRTVAAHAVRGARRIDHR